MQATIGFLPTLKFVHFKLYIWGQGKCPLGEPMDPKGAAMSWTEARMTDYLVPTCPYYN